jgi:hypothetical protein
MAADREVTLNITGEAANINHVADVIGEWADRFGFREDWEDADYLDNLADQLESDDVAEFNLIERSPKLREIAETHRRLANVQKLMLMVSELSEGLSELRNGEPADGWRYGEELADLVIRAFENAQKNRLPIGDIIIHKIDKNRNRPFKHGRTF